ncbi:MAG: hypothetical protein ABIO95_02030, partial [Bdellovibrionota bacterium]
MAKIDPFLIRLLNTPTAPFREHLVSQLLKQELDLNGVPWCEDAHHNLIVGAPSIPVFKKLLGTRTTKPVCFFIAHMDHPGFHVTKALGKGHFEFVWHGGSPLRDLKGASLYVSNLEGRVASAKLLKSKLDPSKRWMESGTLRLDDATAFEDHAAKKIFGGFHFGDFTWVKDQTLYTKAADDLVGCYAIVKAFITQWKKSGAAVQPLALLTIGEEVGWVGAIGHFKEGYWDRLKRPAYVVSVEASRARERAEIGKGPVVRLGDKATIFHARLSQELMLLSCHATRKRFQYRVMDGGTCEGTVSSAWKLDTVALCVPLGNYHNMSLEGGPRASRQATGPAPEFVNLDDLSGLVKICGTLMQQPLG